MLNILAITLDTFIFYKYINMKLHCNGFNTNESSPNYINMFYIIMQSYTYDWFVRKKTLDYY